MREETEGSDQGREEGTMTGEGWRGQPGNMKPRDPWSPLLYTCRIQTDETSL